MSDPRLLYEQGMAAIRQGNPDAALRPLKDALTADPTQAGFWLGYATALLAVGEAPVAAAILQEGAKRGLKGPGFESLAAQFNIADSEATYAAASRLHQDGHWGPAIRGYGLVILADPGHLAAHANLGNARMTVGNADGAAAAFRRALILAPNDAELHNSLGLALGEQNLTQAAEDAYRHAIALAPNFAQPHHNLGCLLLRANRPGDAITLLRRAIALNPDLAGSYVSLATALCAAGKTADSFAVFTEHAERFGAAPEQSPPAPHKARHDREQRAYLGLDEDAPPDVPLRLVDGSRINGAALQPGHRDAAARIWADSRPQIVVIDDFLSPAALEKLRLFCWGSTVWRQVYDDGYLGAMPEQGFACPLLAQIAEEMPRAYPEIFAKLPLRYLWGFKYDSSLKGINIHADKAAVNVNFWITPDSANRDPAHGGLVVWDKAAPLDWEPDQYNGDIAASRAYLASTGAKPVTIPYRANRVVIFDSDLFHETDQIDFAPGYCNRRINITLLYGDRKPDEPG